jgi:hypothetical protein
VVIARAAALLGAGLALAACASVLGVDKTYTLGEGDGGSPEVDGGPGASGIRCAQGGPTCTPGTDECCESASSTLSCVTITPQGACNNGGTDIFCDAPSQCTSGVCCISLQAQGNDLLGTACMTSCPSGQIALCARENGTCAGGLSCKPLTVGAPFGNDWFYGCQ